MNFLKNALIVGQLVLALFVWFGSGFGMSAMIVVFAVLSYYSVGNKAVLSLSVEDYNFLLEYVGTGASMAPMAGLALVPVRNVLLYWVWSFLGKSRECKVSARVQGFVAIDGRIVMVTQVSGHKVVVNLVQVEVGKAVHIADTLNNEYSDKSVEMEVV